MHLNKLSSSATSKFKYLYYNIMAFADEFIDSTEWSRFRVSRLPE